MALQNRVQHATPRVEVSGFVAADIVMAKAEVSEFVAPYIVMAKAEVSEFVGHCSGAKTCPIGSVKYLYYLNQ